MFVMPVLAYAASAREAGLQARVAQLVSSASRGQQHVVRVFPGPDGLLGAVIENAGKQRNIAWLSPNGAVLIDGSLLDGHGKDLDREAKIQQGLILSPEETLTQALEPARHGFLVGTAGPVLTVFFDPNCVYCHQVYGALSPAIAGGRLRVRFVIVGTLKDSSTPRAASLLSAADPAQALARNELHFDMANEEGGFPVDPKVSASMVSAVQANNALFTQAGMDGTPTSLYCDKATHTVHLQVGVPSDIDTFVSHMADIPICLR